MLRWYDLAKAQDSAHIVAAVMILVMFIYGQLSIPWALRKMQEQKVERYTGIHRAK